MVSSEKCNHVTELIELIRNRKHTQNAFFQSKLNRWRKFPGQQAIVFVLHSPLIPPNYL